MVSEKEFLDALGNVDMDKIDRHNKDRRDKIEHALAVLEENVHLLNDWEMDFHYDITIRYTQGATLSDAQFEKLMQVSYKYED